MLNHDQPHVLAQLGNGLFVHVPSHFTNEDIEDYFNNPANPASIKGDVRWKVAPPTADGTPSHADCGSGSGKHVCLTIEGNPYTGGERPHEEGVSTDAGSYFNEGFSFDAIADSLDGTKREGRKTPRNIEPIFDGLPTDVYGYDQLDLIDPNLMTHVRSALHGLLSTDTHLTRVQKEIIMFTTGFIHRSVWTTFFHREVAKQLCGGDMDLVQKIGVEKSFAEIGTMGMAVAAGAPIPKFIADEAIQRGYTPEQILEAVAIGALASFEAGIMVGISPLVPENREEMERLAKRVAEHGYL